MEGISIKQELRINDEISAKEVKLIDESGAQLGVMSLDEALKIAEEKELDLVEVAPGTEPTVCKIMNYGKYKYEQARKEKEAKKKQKVVDVKEIRLSSTIDTHDFEFKAKNARKFLEDGDKVKAYVFFKGRSILFKEQGEVLLLRFANDLEDYAKVDQMPVLEGKRMTIQLSPKKVAAPKKSAAPKPAEDAPKAASAETEEE